MAATWTVLVADDETTARKAMRKMLEKLGLIVAEAADGREALQVLQQSQADLVLLDARMPGLDGFAALVAGFSRRCRPAPRGSGPPTTAPCAPPSAGS